MSQNWLVKRREVDYALFWFTKRLGFTLSTEESSTGGYGGIARIVVEFSGEWVASHPARDRRWVWSRLR